MISRALLISSCLLLAACSGQGRSTPKPEYRVAHKQLPMEPTYARLRWVHLPETHPAASLDFDESPTEKRPKLSPVVHFSITDKPLCDAAPMLAGLARYSSYCSSRLRTNRITLNALGTIDELADRIQGEHSIQVIIDHSEREVRFLPREQVKEVFSEDTTQ